MSRVRVATEGKDYDLAIKLLTAIIDIKPDYIEAWNRRATLYFHKRDYVSAMSDLRSVLTREPRHFGAWAGLGMILQMSATSGVRWRPSAARSSSIRAWSGSPT